MSTHDPVDLTLCAADPPVTVAHGTAFELLVQLSARGRRPAVGEATAEALAALGSDQGELWLHLVGLAMDGRDAGGLVALVERTRPAELVTHLAGLHVPAWRRYVDAARLRAALDGDRDAARQVLGSRGYFAGRARGALAALFARPHAETHALVRDALRGWYREILEPDEERLSAELESRARATEERLRAGEPGGAVGYRHTPEPGIARIVLVPQLAARPRLLLLQHDDARVVCYPAAAAASPEAALAEACKVLGDVQRLELLRRLADAPATMPELARELGVAKTTLHHHLSLLRAAGFLAVARRPDRTYAFELRPDAFERVAAELAGRGRSSSR
jgi:DNA-binding transcriptional ArsR family regulator